MKLKVVDMLDRLHVIIDDVKRTDGEDDFSADKDTELREALLTGAEQLVSEAPFDKLLPQKVIASLGNVQDYDAIQQEYTDGHGSLIVPDDFSRLGELKLKSWSQTLRQLLDPDSQGAHMQACRWTRGTPQKPAALLSTDANGNRVILYWTAGRYQYPNGEAMTQVYDHKIEKFTYIPVPRIEVETTTQNGKTTTTEYIDIPLTEDCEKPLLYRAAGIFMESKKESTLADRLYNLSKL
jgi:hypothetical protein